MSTGHVTLDKTEQEYRLPDLAAMAYRRPTHYAASPELKALYANECQRCGMCCVFYGEGPFRCHVIPLPHQQPPKRFIQIGPRTETAAKPNAENVQVNRYLRIKPDKVWKGHNRCAALDGVQGVNVSCSIYSERPHACSDYEPGSPDCFRVRRWAGLEPLDDGFGRS
jgi:Fe-S-cluster containining protein